MVRPDVRSGHVLRANGSPRTRLAVTAPARGARSPRWPRARHLHEQCTEEPHRLVLVRAGVPVEGDGIGRAPTSSTRSRSTGARAGRAALARSRPGRSRWRPARRPGRWARGWRRDLPGRERARALSVTSTAICGSSESARSARRQAGFPREPPAPPAPRTGHPSVEARGAQALRPERDVGPPGRQRRHRLLGDHQVQRRAREPLLEQAREPGQLRELLAVGEAEDPGAGRSGRSPRAPPRAPDLRTPPPAAAPSARRAASARARGRCAPAARRRGGSGGGRARCSPPTASGAAGGPLGSRSSPGAPGGGRGGGSHRRRRRSWA